MKSDFRTLKSDLQIAKAPCVRALGAFCFINLDTKGSEPVKKNSKDRDQSQYITEMVMKILKKYGLFKLSIVVAFWISVWKLPEVLKIFFGS